MFSVFLEFRARHKIKVSVALWYKEIIQNRIFSFTILFNILWDYQNLPSITIAIDLNQSKKLKKIIKVSPLNA
jgi:hypothetical protein